MPLGPVLLSVTIGAPALRRSRIAWHIT